MDIRPQDLPELRAELAKQYQNPDVVQRWWKSPRPEVEARAVADACTEVAESSDLFHVARSMAELARAASGTLESFALLVDDLPSPNGLMVFDGPAIGEVTYCDGPIAPIHGLQWQAVSGSLFVTPLLGMPRASPTALMPEMRIAFNVPTDGLRKAFPEPGANPALRPRLLSFLVTVFLLMRQPLAAESSLECNHLPEAPLHPASHIPASVRVIELRRPKHSGSDAGESGRTYAHRWITRGHWRQQWYPSREVHRPVWIAPHVKGPEDAPMIGGEKVYAWKR